MKHFLSLADLTAADIGALLDLADAIKANPGDYAASLRGKNVILLFMKPSTRTRVSFEVGVNQLGGHPIVLTSRDLQLGRGETVADTARVFSRYADAVMARVFEHEMLEELARWGSIPVINGLSDRLHPCQVLADLQTIREHRGALAGVALAYVGDGNNMAHSLMFGGAIMGMDVRIGCPAAYSPDPEILARSQALAAESGGAVSVHHDPAAAVAGADIVYTDVWASMGQEEEQQQRLRDFAGFQVDGPLFAQAKDDALFMHCLPAHRGEEVSADVADHARSILFDQAENRLHAQKALLVELLGQR